MPDPGSARPALSDAALRETLDLMGTVVANMAGKLDRHGQILADVQKVAAESRDAAQAAKAHSDPQRYGRHIGQELDKALNATLDRLKALQSGLATDRQKTRRSLEDLVRQEEAVLHHLRDDLEKANSLHSPLRAGPGAGPDYRPAPLFGRQRYRLHSSWG